MSTTDNYLLELRNITKQYPGVLALNEVTMNVKRGDVHGLVGENTLGVT
jgi:ABC-type sugar transport system ATPase subunit